MTQPTERVAHLSRNGLYALCGSLGCNDRLATILLCGCSRIVAFNASMHSYTTGTRVVWQQTHGAAKRAAMGFRARSLPPNVVRTPLAYPCWVRCISCHQLSRLDPTLLDVVVAPNVEVDTHMGKAD